MTQATLPDFTELDLMLTNNSIKQHPSESHGMICGIVCSNQPIDNWEIKITGLSDIKNDDNANKTLQNLYQLSDQLLSNSLFDFQLILPDDSEALPTRAEALTLWCQGFLMGLQIANIPVSGSQKDEVSESIRDLVEIAKMNYEAVVASEEDEEAYTELAEYVRIAVIDVHQDLHHQPSLTSERNLNLH
jgi:uncharacterized protein YgfB (UPF0149 family)